MSTWAETVDRIKPASQQARAAARERQSQLTKPAGSLGVLESLGEQLAGIAGVCPPPVPSHPAVCVFAGDHGVHAQGVTPWPQEVTAAMIANFLADGAVVNTFANQVGADVVVVDVGVATELPAHEALVNRRVRSGTADFTQGPRRGVCCHTGWRGCCCPAGPERRGLPSHRRYGDRKHHRVRRHDLCFHPHSTGTCYRSRHRCGR